MINKITKCIIPVAGFGTRFLPATKAQPKEMLPIVDKPVIQFLVEEAVKSGIKDIIFVTGRGKRAIEDHFDCSFELEYNLVEKGKQQLLEEVQGISEMANFFYVRQSRPLGDGHALLCARHLIGDEPVAVLFGDDLVDSEVPCLKQLMNVFDEYGDPVIALTVVPLKDVSRFGVAGTVKIGERTHEIKKFVEKPTAAEAPSNLAFVGKSILTPDIFEILENRPSSSGEIRLADAFAERSRQSKAFYGYEFEGTRYDCGDKFGFLRATVDFGLRHPETAHDFESYLKSKFGN